MSNRNHVDEAIDAMQAEATNFGYRFINDSRVRANYMSTIRQYSAEIRGAIARGEMTAQEGAEAASAMRNHILDAARLKTSDIGRAAAVNLKAQGLTLPQLLEKYAQSMFKKSFSALSDVQKEQVYLSIVESSGKARPAVNLKTQRLGRLGRGLMVISIGIAVYNISTAEDKLDAAGREGAGIGGGILGGALGGAAAGAMFGPGAVVAVPVGVFIGGIAGALGADFLYDWMKP